MIKGLFEKNHVCIIVVCVTDTDAPLYSTRNSFSVVQSQEKEKKKKYLQPCLEQCQIFVPFVISVDGVLGKEDQSLLLVLANPFPTQHEC
jgi:hypothetical protein